MKRSLIFGLVFSFLFLSIESCSNKKTTLEDNKKEAVLIGSLGEIELPDSIEIRNDIPFSLLVDKEQLKKIPDTVDINIYKPDYVVLKKGFNEKDSLQLDVFPNITVSTLSNKDGIPFSLGQNVKENIVNTIVRNVAGTSYEIVEWKEINGSFTLSDGSLGLILDYVQKQKNTDKRTEITDVWILKDGKLIHIIMSSPEDNYEEWSGYLDKMINNIKFYK